MSGNMEWIDLFGFLAFPLAVVGIAMAANSSEDFFKARILFAACAFLGTANAIYKYGSTSIDAVVAITIVASTALYCGLGWVDKKQYGIYPYLKVMDEDLDNKSAPLPLWIGASGSISSVEYWPYPGHVKSIKDGDYYSMRSLQRRFEDLHAGGERATGTAVSLGTYKFDFTTQKGAFREILQLKEHQGKWVQLLDVFASSGEFGKNGKLLYSSRPDGFVE